MAAVSSGFKYIHCGQCGSHIFTGKGWNIDMRGSGNSGTSCLPFPRPFTGSVFSNTGLIISNKMTDQVVKVIKATSEENDFTLTFVDGCPQVVGKLHQCSETGSQELDMRAPPSYMRAPPSYMRAPPSHMRAPPSHMRAPPSHMQAPSQASSNSAYSLSLSSVSVTGICRRMDDCKVEDSAIPTQAPVVQNRAAEGSILLGIVTCGVPKSSFRIESDLRIKILGTRVVGFPQESETKLKLGEIDITITVNGSGISLLSHNPVTGEPIRSNHDQHGRFDLYINEADGRCTLSPL